MINLSCFHPEYITDENGEKKSVVLSISDFEELMEDIEDLAAIAERRAEKRWPFIKTFNYRNYQDRP